MRRCCAKPYEGSEKYIFASYCHADGDAVFPIIERLSGEGYLIWYDEGIDPGDEWPETIASHLNGCEAFIAFISKKSVDSHNCRREITYAILKNKPFVSVMLEDVQLTPGMEMQLTANQCIYKYLLQSEDKFYEKLHKPDFFNACRGTTGQPFPRLENKTAQDLGTNREKCGDTPSDEPEEQKAFAKLVRENLGEEYLLKATLTSVGRSEEKSDIYIKGNSAIGRVHCFIEADENGFWLTDNDSTNGTFLNNVRLEPMKRVRLKDNDRLVLANDCFVFRSIN